MDEIKLKAAPIFGGKNISVGGNQIVERSDLALVSIATPMGGETVLEKTLKANLGLETPASTVFSVAGAFRAIRTTPDQILLIFSHETPDANTYIANKLDGKGYTTDQTDVWVILEISGPDTLAALERICMLDLNENIFPIGGFVRTVMDHMGAIIIRLGLSEFMLLSARSSAQSFLHTVETSYHFVTTKHPTFGS